MRVGEEQRVGREVPGRCRFHATILRRGRTGVVTIHWKENAMTEPIGSNTRNEKLYSSADDEPLVSEAKAQKGDTGRSSGSSEKSPPLACTWEDVDRDEVRAPNFGAFAKYDASGSNVRSHDPIAGARGASQDPEPPPPELPYCSDAPRGPGIAFGVSGSGLVAVGLGAEASVGFGVILHREGISTYSTQTKLPGQCDASDGTREACTIGIGSTLGIGVGGQLLRDVDAMEGDGKTFSVDAGPASGQIGRDSNGNLTSVGGFWGVSKGGAVTDSHTVTHVEDVGCRPRPAD